MELVIYTDGGAAGNPGPAAYAFIIYRAGKILTKDGLFIGKSTNNFAEYSGVLAALNKIVDLKKAGKLAGIAQITFKSDSSLMVNQLNGLFKVKNSAIRDFVFKIRTLENEIGLPISYKHIPREQNSRADSIVKDTIKNPR